MNPKKASDWRINKDGTILTDEKEIAKAFNQYFVSKTSDLKAGIDQSFVTDPLEKSFLNYKSNLLKRS